MTISIFDKENKALKALKKIEKQKLELRAKDQTELNEQLAIKNENAQRKAEWESGDNYRWGIGKSPFERLLLLMSRYDPVKGQVKVMYYERSTGRARGLSPTPKPEYYTLAEAIEKMNLQPLAKLINELCEPAKPFVSKPETYDKLKAEFDKKWNSN